MEIIFKQYPEISPDEIYLLKNIFDKQIDPKKLEIIFKEYPDINIEKLGSESFVETISSAQTENLKIILNRYDIDIDELALWKDVLKISKSENLKIILEHYSEIGLDGLNKLKDILSRVQYSKIFNLVFEKFENITVDELNSLSDVLI